MKEEKVIILDYLPNGYPGMKKIEPVAQTIGYHFTLLEISPVKEVKVGEVINLEDKEKVEYIRRKLKEKDLTNFAKNNLLDVVKKIVKEKEDFFVKFFNRATRISIRMHQLELIPSLGKKHVQIILRERKKPFESFEDIKKRVSTTIDIEDLIARRIVKELKGEEKYNLFVHYFPTPASSKRYFTT
jgi:putative nucleotide binding protein